MNVIRSSVSISFCDMYGTYFTCLRWAFRLQPMRIVAHFLHEMTHVSPRASVALTTAQCARIRIISQYPARSASTAAHSSTSSRSSTRPRSRSCIRERPKAPSRTCARSSRPTWAKMYVFGFELPFGLGLWGFLYLGLCYLVMWSLWYLGLWNLVFMLGEGKPQEWTSFMGVYYTRLSNWFYIGFHVYDKFSFFNLIFNVP